MVGSVPGVTELFRQKIPVNSALVSASACGDNSPDDDGEWDR